MFTGIVETTAKILQKTPTGLTLERPEIFDDVKQGSSISVSGACLTVAQLDRTALHFDVVQETWDRTKLGALAVGDRVNLERALAANGRFEGHVVQGHVEGVGRVISFIRTDATATHRSERVPSLTPLSENLPPPRSLRSHPSPATGEGLGVGATQMRVERSVDQLRYPPKTVVERARMMRKEPTRAEAVLWDAIRDEKLGVYFRRQRPVGNDIIDFYCEDLRLGVELDGEIHQFQREEDQERQEELRRRGVRLLRFRNEQVLEDLEAVLNSLRAELNKPSVPPSPVAGEGLAVGASSEPWSSALLTVELPADLLPYVVFKGSIALDGVALTVAKLEQQLCTIALIPHTLAITTLGTIKEGDGLNVETDVLGRYVRRMLDGYSPASHEA